MKFLSTKSLFVKGEVCCSDFGRGLKRQQSLIEGLLLSCHQRNICKMMILLQPQSNKPVTDTQDVYMDPAVRLRSQLHAKVLVEI